MPARRVGVFWILAFFLGPLLLASQALAAEVSGRVMAIADRDTLTVLTEARQQVKIRLSDIDTPESAQPYGSRARQELSALVFGKDVRVETRDTDRYGRTVGRVHAGTVDVNAEMVRRGAAWVYRRYSRDPALVAVEAEARTARRGVWALPEAERVPPWEWRASAAASSTGERPQVAQAAPPATTLPAGGFNCGTKRYCGQMTSCAEARFHFTQCGLTRLDGDGDGVPCEQLCR